MVSELEIITIAGHGIATLIELYAAYWAFRISRALAVRLYRNQAMGIGLVCIGFASLDFDQVVVAATTNQPIVAQTFFPILFFSFYMLFYWIDASMRAARRSDPLLRDTLHWSKVRIPLWGLALVSLLLSLYVAFTDLSLLGPNQPFQGWIFLSISLPIFVSPLFLGVAALRSKDMAFRTHLKWFGIFTVLLTLILFTTIIFQTPVASLLAYAFIFLADYSLYRSAKSLAPLNRISLSDTD